MALFRSMLPWLGVAAVSVIPTSTAALSEWDDQRMLLLVLRTRGTLCQPEESCVAGRCASDGVTSCTRTIDCPRCITVENRDVAMCEPLSLGANNTSCRWSLFFDGTRAGLKAPIQALEILRDGSLLMRTSADNAIPDISGANRRDLVRFAPTDTAGRPQPFQLPYIRGKWSLFLDGRAVDSNSGSRLMDGIAVLPNSCRDVNGDGKIEAQECDVLFSPTAGGTLGGIKIETEDIIRCRPSALTAGGTIAACDYSLFYDASEVNDFAAHDNHSENNPGSWRSGGTSAFAVLDYDPEWFRAAVLFSAGNEPTLPMHQPSRDLLLNVGHVGPRGRCESDGLLYCMSPDDCPADESCDHTMNPETDTRSTDLLFDGSNVLGGEMLAAVAVVDDRDGDRIPDPLDNCPDIPNPRVCADAGTLCGDDSDCPVGERCAQPDADDDGIGDACDICDGRGGGTCACGDFVVEPQSEQCDLGSPELGGINGLPGSPCDAECRLVGRCTRSQVACVVATDCPEHAEGEGCCGNGIVDHAPDASNSGADELCDDANGIDDDACGNYCRPVQNSVPLPQECEGIVGTRVVPTFVRTLRFQKQRRQVPADSLPHNYSKWSSRGEFSLVPGIEFDPDSQRVELIFNQGSATCKGGEHDGTACSSSSECPDGRCSSNLYKATLAPENFAQAGLRRDRPRWSFNDRNGALFGAEAWTKGRFSQRLATIRRPLNVVKYMLQGRGDRLDPQFTLTLDPHALGGPPTRVRQTIVIGDLCTTQVLTCEGNRSGTTLQCFSRFE